MISRDEAYELIVDLNEEAHSATYDEWEYADEVDAEGRADEAEDLREDASYNQSIEFREAFQSLDTESQEAILHYVKVDEDFAEEFNMWWGQG